MAVDGAHGCWSASTRTGWAPKALCCGAPTTCRGRSVSPAGSCRPAPRRRRGPRDRTWRSTWTQHSGWLVQGRGGATGGGCKVQRGGHCLGRLTGAAAFLHAAEAPLCKLRAGSHTACGLTCLYGPRMARLPPTIVAQHDGRGHHELGAQAQPLHEALQHAVEACMHGVVCAARQRATCREAAPSL